VQEFRKENYTVHARYYVCEDTGEKFTTTEQDELKFNELYGQYRVRHGIPFPEEIKATREKYGLSLAAISKILGFGINQYANYENGQVPSESNGKMILAARNKDFMVSLLDSSREQFSETEYTKIRNSILSAPEESASDKLNALFYSDTTCSVYNGFGSLNTNKLANMVKFFLFKEGSVFPTKLNKEMFYADFAHYRKHGRSISGLRYKAIKYGPVPYHYDTIYDNIDGLEKNIVISHNSESTCLSCDGYDAKLFSTDELSTLESVFAITKDLTTEQIVKESHKEPAWTDYKSQNGFIPYSEAFNLVLL
jgi:transcriptional regulator with XRE-family HTH domain